MKIKAMLLTALLLGAGVATVHANKARLDVFSNDKIELKPVSGPQGGYFNNINWGDKEKRKFSLCGETATLSNDKWVMATFSFIPQESGKVNVQLKGAYTRGKDKKNIDQNWVYFDDVKVTGATVVNGDFEEEVLVKEEPMPKGWWLASWQKVKGIFVKDKTQASQGNNCIKVWHNCACSQSIDVVKDQEVKITVMVKGGETVLATE